MRTRTGIIHFDEETEFQSLTLDESVSKDNGILGVVRGTFCVMESPSRNGRMYPFKVWKRVVENKDFQRKLGNRVIFGTVGHLETDTDTLIAELKVSHRLTKLDIHEGSNIGNGEAEILDTPVGRVLYTLLKSGSKMAVSSKAEGSYAGKQDSVSVVDENTFEFDRFDFVTDPGFLQAQPKLLESLQEAYSSTEHYKLVKESNEETNARDFLNDKNHKEVLNMELIEQLTKQKIELETKLDEATSAVSKLTAEQAAQVAALKKDLEEAKAKLSQWEDVCIKWGGSAKIQDRLSEVKKLEETAGTVNEVIETLKRTDEFVDKVLSLGSISELKAYKQDSATFKSLVQEVGSPKDIKESINGSLNFIKRVAEAGRKKKAEALSSKFGIDVAKAKSMLEKMSYKMADATLSDLKESLTVKPDKKKDSKDTKGSIVFGEANRSRRMLGAMGNK